MPSCTVANQSFTTLYADHHSWLFGWLRGKLGNAAEAAAPLPPSPSRARI